MASVRLELAPRLLSTDMSALSQTILDVMHKHEEEGCRYAPGAHERVVMNAPMSHCPLELLEYFDQALESEGIYCPERGVDRRRENMLVTAVVMSL